MKEIRIQISQKTFEYAEKHLQISSWDCFVNYLIDKAIHDSEDDGMPGWREFVDALSLLREKGWEIEIDVKKKPIGL